MSARVFQRNDGSVDSKVNGQDVPFVLYDTELDGFSFIDETCQALFDNDPDTVPVQPFASGTAKFKESVSTSPDGVEEIFNGVTGFATSMAS